MFARLLERWRKWRTNRRMLREITPEAMRRLAEEVDGLSLCAAMACPSELSLQCVLREYYGLRSRATAPALAGEPAQIRLQLRQGLIHSRQQFILSLQTTAQPTRFLQ